MTKRFHSPDKNGLVLVPIVVVMVLLLFTGCSTAEKDATAKSAQPASAEDCDVIPADLLSDDMNLFFGVSFPEGYTVYAAGVEDNVNSVFYQLYLTAQGEPEEIITYLSKLLGNEDEESIQKSIDVFQRDGGVGIDGRLDAAGFDVNCKITPTEKDDHNYDFVDGCNLRLTASIEDASRYRKIIEDNYNLNSLSDVAKYFDVMPITGQSKIFVRKNQNNAQIDAVYNTIEDVAGIMKSIKAELKYEGFDENNNNINLLRYGEVSNSIMFAGNDTICIFQNLSDAGKNYKDYKLATNKLIDMGFTNYIETDALCEYKDDANKLNITINIPEWGSRPEAWENSCVTFIKEMNGYLLVIWYYPDEHRYAVQSDRDSASVKYECFAKTGEFSGEYPDRDTVKAQFEAMYSGLEVQDVFMEGIELFQEYVNSTFGMSIDQLYQLAVSE
ncbi:MAG: hypothetical protein PHC91_03815 [Eubacteriales bacterium]|nr:hypothetical protein [Eubacteriales bacterium]